MKRILVSAAALTLLIGSPALAQDNGHKDNGGKHDNAAPAKADKGDHNGGGHGNGGGNHGGPNGGGNHGAPNGGDGNHGNPNAGGNHGPAANFQPDRGHDRNDRNFNGNGGRDNHNPNWNQNNNRNPNWNRNGNVNRGNMQRPRTFDRRQYQRNFNAQRRFRAGTYRRPNGFYYRRWGFGQTLPFAFFARDYWLNDYYAYDLAVPPYGYEWVRYGDDAILVDVRSGAILQVEYGVFY